MNARNTIKNMLGMLLPKVIITNGKRSSNKISLTFDDGPHPENSSKILDILEKHNVKATFFLMGEECAQNREVVLSMHNKGHQIANHGTKHFDVSDVSLTDYISDVSICQNVMRNITGNKVNKYFRPPYGAVNLLSLIRLILNGYKFVFWTTDSDDSFISQPDKLLNNIKSKDIKGGDILLFHEDYDQTVKILSEVIVYLKSKSFELVTIDNLISNS